MDPIDRITSIQVMTNKKMSLSGVLQIKTKMRVTRIKDITRLMKITKMMRKRRGSR